MPSPSASPPPQYFFDGVPVTVGHSYVSADGYRYLELNPHHGQGIGSTGRYIGVVREDNPSLTKEEQ